MSKKDLDWSDVLSDAANAENRMFGQNMTATELKELLTNPQNGHSIPEKFVEDFFEFANAVHCDISIMAFYRWYRLPSLTDDEWEVVSEALKQHRALLHTMMESDIGLGLHNEPAHKSLQAQTETTTSLINRLGLCRYREQGSAGIELWCALDTHPSNIPHQLA